MSEAGKGSGRRPTLVTDTTFEERWNAIFMREEDNVFMEDCSDNGGASDAAVQLESVPGKG